MNDTCKSYRPIGILGSVNCPSVLVAVAGMSVLRIFMLANDSGASDAASITRPRIVCVGRASWANKVIEFNHPHTIKQMKRNCFAMSC